MYFKWSLQSYSSIRTFMKTQRRDHSNLLFNIRSTCVVHMAFPATLLIPLLLKYFSRRRPQHVSGRNWRQCYKNLQSPPRVNKTSLTVHTGLCKCISQYQLHRGFDRIGSSKTSLTLGCIQSVYSIKVRTRSTS